MDRVVVTGERSWQYAYRLGIPLEKIRRGIYGIDYQSWFPLWQERQNTPWPRSLLFVGRYTQEKGVDVLIEAYRQYYEQVNDPWSLICCGKGELEHQLETQPGIKNLGFVQPHQMQTIWQNAGAFVLPSRFDPWPLALVEAAAAGLPVICTDACGSAVEVIRSEYNGVIIPPNNSQALAQAFMILDQNYPSLPEWGKRAQQFAAPYDAKLWAMRWQKWCKELITHELP
jgi:glycosyltransferase involved in cell wall biosynthesis